MCLLSADWLLRVDERREVTEENLDDLCTHIVNLDMLRIYLGFSEAQLAQVRMANPYYPSNQALKMLCDWRAREYRNATVRRLVDALRRSGVADNVLQRIFAPN